MISSNYLMALVYMLCLEPTSSGGHPFYLNIHTSWRLRAIQAAENLDEGELIYTANVALSEVDFQSLREEMVVFIKHFIKQVEPSPSENIACFNLDWFWIRS